MSSTTGYPPPSSRQPPLNHWPPPDHHRLPPNHHWPPSDHGLIIASHRRPPPDRKGYFWKWTRFFREFNPSTKRPKICMHGKTILRNNISRIKIPKKKNWNPVPNPPLRFYSCLSSFLFSPDNRYWRFFLFLFFFTY